MTPEQIAELIRHLGNSSGSDAPALTAAQWAALRFFARANRLTRNPSAFARFHGTTRGTASQTVQSLVAADYLIKRRDPCDRRRVVFELTESGATALTHDPSRSLEQAIAALPDGVRAHLTDAVQTLVAAVDRTGTPFGCCDSCCYLYLAEGEQRACCAVTGEAVAEAERARLCVAYQPAATAGTD